MMPTAIRFAVLLIAAFALGAGSNETHSPLDPLVKVLARVEDPAIQRDVLRGMYEALQDRQSAPLPEGWTALYSKLQKSDDPEVRQKSALLALLFGDAQARRAMRELAADSSADPARRSEALQLLVQTRDADLVPLLNRLLDDPHMTGAALQALAAYADPQTPSLILAHYSRLSDARKRDALATLTSRSPSAQALLEAVADGRLPRQDLTAFDVRQMVNLNDPAVDAQLKKVWGEVHGTSKDKLQLLAQYKSKFTPEVMKKADLPHGRLIFSRTCGVCHSLFGSGGEVGPNLTGAQRANLDYVLGKVLDPSAVVSRDYRMTIIRLRDGRVINGIVQRETDAAVTLKAPNETIVVQKADIEKQKVSNSSLMPEGLLSAMSTDDARDLLAYLASPAQAPLPDKP